MWLRGAAQHSRRPHSVQSHKVESRPRATSTSRFYTLGLSVGSVVHGAQSRRDGDDTGNGQTCTGFGTITHRRHWHGHTLQPGNATATHRRGPGKGHHSIPTTTAQPCSPSRRTGTSFMRPTGDRAPSWTYGSTGWCGAQRGGRQHPSLDQNVGSEWVLAYQREIFRFPHVNSVLIVGNDNQFLFLLLLSLCTEKISS